MSWIIASKELLLTLSLTVYAFEVYTNFLKSSSDPCTFENILPGDYTIRVINDLNKNNLWDTGNFLKKIKPEPTYHHNDTIKVRANWVIRERL